MAPQQLLRAWRRMFVATPAEADGAPSQAHATEKLQWEATKEKEMSMPEGGPIVVAYHVLLLMSLVIRCGIRRY